jgi:hypothetical protein
MEYSLAENEIRRVSGQTRPEKRKGFDEPVDHLNSVKKN